MPAPGNVSGPVALIVIEPVLLAMLMPVPAVRVDFVSVLPVVLPISSWPFVYVVWPVPPCATLSGVVRPVSEVMSLFAPEPAAPIAARAMFAVAAVNRPMPRDVPPRLTRAVPAFVAPVPPCEMAIGVLRLLVSASTTFVPSQYRIAAPFCTTATPVPPDVLTVSV
jgi:hypothetical protein